MQKLKPGYGPVPGELPGTPSTTLTLAKSNAAQRSRRLLNCNEPLLKTWILTILASAFFALTVCYAFESSIAARIPFIGDSSSRPIVAIRVLSEIVAILLGATIRRIFQSLQHMLVSHQPLGLWLTDFMIFEPGVGFFGLIRTLLGGDAQRLATRGWSAVRLFTITIIPLLGVLIMSNLEPRLVVSPAPSSTSVSGYGIGNFNASLAEFWAPISDLVFSIDFNEFFVDPRRAVDITEATARDACDSQTSNVVPQGCQLSYFVPGDIENIVPGILEQPAATSATAFLSQGQRSLLFEFYPNNQQWDSNNTEPCNIYGFDAGAWSLCLLDQGNNSIQTRIAICSADIATGKGCLHDTSWISNVGWSTQAVISYVQANIAYSQQNGSILWYEILPTSPVPANIAVSDLLQTYNILLNASEPNSMDPLEVVLSAVGMASKKQVIPFVIWWYYYSIGELGSQELGASSRAFQGLYSLLATPVYFCQAKGFSEFQRITHNITNGPIHEVMSLLPSAEPDTTVTPAVLRYALSVGHGSLIAYIVLGGVTLVICYILLAVVTIVSFRETLEITPYPTLNFLLKYVISDENGDDVTTEHFRELDGLNKRDLPQYTARMKVTLAGKTTSSQRGIDNP